MVGNICYYFYSLQTSAVHTYTYIYTRTHPARTIPEIMYNDLITPKITQLNHLSRSLSNHSWQSSIIWGLSIWSVIQWVTLRRSFQDYSTYYICVDNFKLLVKEYMRRQFQLFLDSNSIFHRITCPHTTQQNGIAERKHRRVTEMGLSLLVQSHLPTIYWVDTFLTAIFPINRLPTPALENNSPFSHCLANTLIIMH